MLIFWFPIRRDLADHLLSTAYREESAAATEISKVHFGKIIDRSILDLLKSLSRSRNIPMAYCSVLVYPACSPHSKDLSSLLYFLSIRKFLVGIIQLLKIQTEYTAIKYLITWLKWCISVTECYHYLPQSKRWLLQLCVATERNLGYRI